MTEDQFYVPSAKMNFKLSEIEIKGDDISVGGYTYKRIGKRPRGRQIERVLSKVDNPELKLILYK
tara:strand:+ start:299 stop:493 length:195 start_codon:yes stop_codon:yes gene_type:complete